jgi:predicted dehydrogenase
MNRKYRVGLIGSTQRGGYGHGIDSVWSPTSAQSESVFAVVAIADDDPARLATTGKRLGVARLYASYREMLAREKLDIVGIGPRWVSDRVAMVTAAAEAGCHIFLEKPQAATLHDADAMAAACERARVK